MKNRKKVAIFFLVLMLVLLSSCSKNEKTESEAPQPNDTKSELDLTNENESTKSESNTENNKENKSNNNPKSDFELREKLAKEYLKKFELDYFNSLKDNIVSTEISQFQSAGDYSELVEGSKIELFAFNIDIKLDLKNSKLDMDKLLNTLKYDNERLTFDESKITLYMVFVEDDELEVLGILFSNNPLFINPDGLEDELKNFLLNYNISVKGLEAREAVERKMKYTVNMFENLIYNADLGYGVNIIDSKIVKFELHREYSNIIPNATIEVWEFEYIIKPEDISKVILAGAMGEEDGWLYNVDKCNSVVMIKTENSYEYLVMGDIFHDCISDNIEYSEESLRKLLKEKGFL